MRIAVLGGGNGAFAAAADLTERGHEVRHWRRNAAGLRERIVLRDAGGSREVRIARACAEVGDAVRGAELVLLPDPAFTQADNARRLAPLLDAGQVVLLAPGTFGAYVVGRALGERCAVAETGTLPWLTRRHGPDTAAVTARATRLPTGVYPARRRDQALAAVKAAFPAVEPVEDALSAALTNAGPVIHPPLIFMNAGPLEHFERWDIHKEGTQPSVRRVTDALDAERIALREALGYGAPHFPLADHYAKEGDEWMYGRGSHDRLTDSGDWREHIVLTQHRYMLEDTRIGLSFWLSVAALVNLRLPLAHAFLSIGSAICGEDFMATGRTLAGMGLGRLDRAALQRLLRVGFA